VPGAAFAMGEHDQRGLKQPGQDDQGERAADDHDGEWLLVSEPIPRETAAGKRPSMATKVDMRTGRSRRWAARRALSSAESPFSRNCRA